VALFSLKSLQKTQKVLTKQCQHFLVFNAEICSFADTRLGHIGQIKIAVIVEGPFNTKY
jgi:hypothetical protein